MSKYKDRNQKQCFQWKKKQVELPRETFFIEFVNKFNIIKELWKMSRKNIASSFRKYKSLTNTIYVPSRSLFLVVLY